jgi:twitching motility protein PilT
MGQFPLNDHGSSADHNGVDLDSLLRAAVDAKASDLHLKVDQPPIIRHDGDLRPLEGWAPLESLQLEQIVRHVGASDPKRLAAFDESGDLDTAYQSAGLPRFRVNAFRQRGEISFAFRVIPSDVPNFDGLRLPRGVRRLSDYHHGLVLVTGATGAGKTTTLAAIIGHINKMRRQHIVTIEDPIEILHEDKLSMVNQREVRVDTEDFHVALRAAMRQDPDVILVGEMRDHQTVNAALAAAETGHFVMSTLHTTDAQETISRIIDFFPPYEQKQVRLSLAGALRGIVCQRLVPRSDGTGRCVAVEICVNTGRVADAIIDPEKTSTITQLIADGGFYGMQTFDHHLMNLIQDGAVSIADAMAVSSNPHDLTVELRRVGLVA